MTRVSAWSSAVTPNATPGINASRAATNAVPATSAAPPSRVHRLHSRRPGSAGRPCATLRSTFNARAGAVLPVTGPATGGAGRGAGAPSWLTGTQGAVGALLVVLALGLALRLIIAYLVPGSGFGVD